MSKVVVMFDNFGPYHLARLRALSQVCDLIAIELFGRSSEYAWKSRGQVDFTCWTIAHGEKPNRVMGRALRNVLNESLPEAVFVPGWSSRGALEALRWCEARGVPAILMSDSREEDSSRNAFSEFLKRRIVSGFSGALVAGSAHRRYALSLGIPGSHVRMGYDVVDNYHFESGANYARENRANCKDRLKLHNEYFITSARFVEKKNLFFLVSVYKEYRNCGRGVLHDLVILGDGPLRARLEEYVRELELCKFVHFPGFVQYDELPAYYGLAKALIMPSTTDQWGLVVNEAMASGIPVLVSSGCGSAEDLVIEGENGNIFDPWDHDSLLKLLSCYTDKSTYQLQRMGLSSKEIVSEFDPEVFAAHAVDLVEQVRQYPPRKLTRLNQLIISIIRMTRGRT